MTLLLLFALFILIACAWKTAAVIALVTTLGVKATVILTAIAVLFGALQ